MDTRVSYILLGLFVIGLGAGLIAGVLWLSTGGLVKKNYQQYLVYSSESVSGLSVDSKVKYQGVDVGRVAKMSLVPEKPKLIRLLLDIEKGTPIREDTVATLHTLGLTGLAFVNLKGGSAESPPLRQTPGQPYPVIKSEPSLFSRLEDTAETLLSRLSETSKRLNELLGPDNQRKLGQTLDHLNSLTGDLAAQAGRLGPILDDLGGTLKNVRVASKDFPALVSRFRSAAESIDNMAKQIELTAADARHRMNRGSDALSRFGRSVLPETEAMVKDLRETAINLRRMSEELERDPSVLLLGPPESPPGPGE